MKKILILLSLLASFSLFAGNIELAKELKDSKQYDQAKRELTIVASISTGDIKQEALYLLGDVNLRLGNLSGTKSAWSALVKISKTSFYGEKAQARAKLLGINLFDEPERKANKLSDFKILEFRFGMTPDQFEKNYRKVATIQEYNLIKFTEIKGNYLKNGLYQIIFVFKPAKDLNFDSRIDAIKMFFESRMTNKNFALDYAEGSNYETFKVIVTDLSDYNRQLEYYLSRLKKLEKSINKPAGMKKSRRKMR